VDYRLLVLCLKRQIVSGCGLWGYRQGMYVNGLKIEPGANLMGADLTGADLTGARMPDGTIHD